MPTSPYTRREFLHTGLAMVSTAATVPTFLQHSALAAQRQDEQSASYRGSAGERILVVVQLSGGNDGLNTVVPFGMREYYNARPSLAIREDDVIKLSKPDGIGLHGEMAALKELYDQGLVGIIQGVGYPNPNRSHFASMDIWHTADPAGGRGLGWVGRAMDQLAEAKGDAFNSTACVCIGNEAPLAAQGRRVKPVSFENANLFRWVGADLHTALASEYDKIHRADAGDPAPRSAAPLHPEIPTGSEAAFVLRTAQDAQVASDKIRAAVAKGPQTTFPQSRLASQLRMVAAMIRAGLPTRVYYVGMGGFDTHANQPYGHGRRLREFSQAVKAFYAELKSLGEDGRVMTVAFSEFGRRVAQNASNGTDHGTAGPMFVVGPMIKPGLHGQHPSLSKLDNGDLVYNVDFRNIYAGVLEHWLKLDSTKVLGKSFRAEKLTRNT